MSWREPTCPRCMADFHRIRTGPKRGLGIYTECWNCEAARRELESEKALEERRRVIASESEEHWRKVRELERGRELAEDLGEEDPMPNPSRFSIERRRRPHAGR